MILEVDRADFDEVRIITNDCDLRPGQIRLTVQRFALTTNNITYAVAGDMLDYWGFGTVAESAHPDIAVGGRYFGFYPMATEVVIDAEPRNGGFRDVGAHRARHAATYTDFRGVTTDALFRPDQADEYLVLWGMFMTSFLAADRLAHDPTVGVAQTIITSASSKTSICLAHCLSGRDDHRSIGITSARHRAFVEGLGLYDEVITYDDIDRLDPSVDSALVDMAGSRTVLADVHTRLADTLRVSLAIGVTHRDDAGLPSSGQPELPGPRPELFFAPAHAARRVTEWGGDELDARLARSFHRLLDTTEQWLTIEHRYGADGVESAYRSLLDGRAHPNTGLVVSMHDAAPA